MLRDRATLPLVVPLALAAAVGALVLRTFALRAGHPYDLEWMEGGVLAHAWRVLHGQPIYVEPGPDFIPMVYTPGYYYVLAALGAVTGLSTTVGRLVSIAGTLAAAAALVWGAKARFGRPLLGLVAAGVWLGTYEHTGAFMDLVRPDALAVGLLAWSLVLATDPRPRVVGLAGGLLFLAFLAKHNVAAFGVPVVLGLWAWRGWRTALVFGLAAAVPGLLFTVAIQVATDGNFLRYVVEVPRSHPIVAARAVPGTVRETGNALAVVAAALAVWSLFVTPRVAPALPRAVHVGAGTLAAMAAVGFLRAMPVVEGIPHETELEGIAAYAMVGAGGAAVLTGLVAMLRARRFHGPWLYGTSVLLTAGVTGALMRAHHGGFMNVFMPLHWVLCATLVVLLADLLDELPGIAGGVVAAAVPAFQLGLQLSSLELDRLLPTPEDVAAGDQVVAALREVEGPILAPFSPWYAAQAGHAPGFHLIALWDINHADGPFRDRVETITRAIRARHYGAVLDADRSMGFGVPKAYQVAQSFDFRPGVLVPRTGWRRRPGALLLPGPPKPVAQSPAAEEVSE